MNIGSQSLLLFWSMLELMVALFASCLPTLRPLIQQSSQTTVAITHRLKRFLFSFKRPKRRWPSKGKVLELEDTVGLPGSAGEIVGHKTKGRGIEIHVVAERNSNEW